jgi:hypothetical protein
MWSQSGVYFRARPELLVLFYLFVETKHSLVPQTVTATWTISEPLASYSDIFPSPGHLHLTYVAGLSYYFMAFQQQTTELPSPLPLLSPNKLKMYTEKPSDGLQITQQKLRPHWIPQIANMMNHPLYAGPLPS